MNFKIIRCIMYYSDETLSDSLLECIIYDAWIISIQASKIHPYQQN